MFVIANVCVEHGVEFIEGEVEDRGVAAVRGAEARRYDARRGVVVKSVFHGIWVKYTEKVFRYFVTCDD